jgi:hypothetical protein
VSYDVAIFGDLLLEEKALRAWKRSSVTSAGVRAIAQAFPKVKNDPAAKVTAIVTELSRVGFFKLEELDGLVRVHGQFHDLAFQRRARQLAALFMSTAQFGAQGTITFLGEGVFVGYEIFLDGGRAKLRVMEEDEVRRAAQDPALDAISGHFQAAVPTSSGVVSRGDGSSVALGDPDVGPLSNA